MKKISSEARVERNALRIALLTMLVAWYFQGQMGLFSSLLGSSLVLISFRIWRILIPLLTGTKKAKSKFTLIFIILAKICVLALFIWAVTAKNSTEPLAFFLGLSCIVASICWEALSEAVQETFRKAR